MNSNHDDDLTGARALSSAVPSPTDEMLAAVLQRLGAAGRTAPPRPSDALAAFLAGDDAPGALPMTTPTLVGVDDERLLRVSLGVPTQRRSPVRTNMRMPFNQLAGLGLVTKVVLGVSLALGGATAVAAAGALPNGNDGSVATTPSSDGSSGSVSGSDDSGSDDSRSGAVSDEATSAATPSDDESDAAGDDGAGDDGTLDQGHGDNGVAADDEANGANEANEHQGEDRADHSGPGRGGDDEADHSGPGRGGDDEADDSSSGRGDDDAGDAAVADDHGADETGDDGGAGDEGGQDDSGHDGGGDDGTADQGGGNNDD